MPVFLIHYELLQKPDVEYPTLIPTLTRLGAARLTSTAWAVRAEMGVADASPPTEANHADLPVGKGMTFQEAHRSDKILGPLDRVELHRVVISRPP